MPTWREKAVRTAIVHLTIWHHRGGSWSTVANFDRHPPQLFTVVDHGSPAIWPVNCGGSKLYNVRALHTPPIDHSTRFLGDRYLCSGSCSNFTLEIKSHFQLSCIKLLKLHWTCENTSFSWYSITTLYYSICVSIFYFIFDIKNKN